MYEIVNIVKSHRVFVLNVSGRHTPRHFFERSSFTSGHFFPLRLENI